MSDQYNDHQAGEFVEDVAADHTTPATESQRFAAGEKLSPERVGEMAVKFASETAFAAAGVANVIAEKAREFFETQRKQLAEKTPEGVDPNFKQFVDTMPDQFKVFLDEVTKQYHELAERGRHAVSDFQAQVQTARAERPTPGGAFDIHEGADATDADAVVAPEGTVPESTFVAEDTTGYSAPVEDVNAEQWPGETEGERRS